MKFRLSMLLLALLLPGLLFAGPITGTCSCSGSTSSGGSCSCNCKGSSCVCACSVGDGCSCVATLSPSDVLSLSEGTTVGSAASTVSKAIGRQVVVRAGADQVIPREIDNTTGWQILARLGRLPGVKLTVKKNEILRTSNIFSEEEQGIAAFPPTHVLSVCTVGATLGTVLDRISEHTGAAFDVVGDLSTTVNGQAKGTVQEVIDQLSTETGTSITLAAD